MDEEDAFPWHLGVFDAHCHPTDTLSSLQAIPGMRAKVLTVMATRAQDQELVVNAADEYGLSAEEIPDPAMDWRQHKIIPAFGWHPWFSHQMFDEAEYDGATTLSREQKAKHYGTVLTPQSDDEVFLQALPDPRPFGLFISQTRDLLTRYPLALVGEVGLDRVFKIPEAWLPEQAHQRDDALTPGGREGRRLSPYQVDIEHQKKVLQAQLRLAGEKQRAVSIHGVKAHGLVFETISQTWKGYERPSKREKRKQEAEIKALGISADAEEVGAEPKPYPPRICLHSFSGPAEAVTQYLAPSVPCDVFFSFSTTINNWPDGGGGKVEAVVKAVPDHCILVESDLHTAGEDMDHYLEDIVRKICGAKGWALEDGVKQLGRNWKRFVFGETA